MQRGQCPIYNLSSTEICACKLIEHRLSSVANSSVRYVHYELDTTHTYLHTRRTQTDFVTLALPSLHGRSLEITITVPLEEIAIKRWSGFRFIKRVLFLGFYYCCEEKGYLIERCLMEGSLYKSVGDRRAVYRGLQGVRGQFIEVCRGLEVSL